MVELHDLLVAFGQQQGVELVETVNFAEDVEEFELGQASGTLAASGSVSTCLNSILMISGFTTRLRLVFSSTSFVSTKMNSRYIILRHSNGRQEL